MQPALPENGSVISWMVLPLRRYAEFTGRSGRREFWWYSLFLALAYTAILLLGAGLATAFESGRAAGITALASFALFLGTFIPGLALTVRRFHDLGVSGHMTWLVYGGMIFFSILAWFAYLVVMALPGKPVFNSYGPPVYGEDLAGVFT